MTREAPIFDEPRRNVAGLDIAGHADLLESEGLEAVLVDTREVRMVPGRKSDVKDCQWLQRLHSCGLLRGGFRPSEDIAAVRTLLREKDSLVAMRTQCVLQMQKSCDQMNIRHWAVPLAWQERGQERAAAEALQEHLARRTGAEVCREHPLQIPDGDGAFFRSVARRTDRKTAVKATARRMAHMIYRGVRYGAAYLDKGAEAFEARARDKAVKAVKAVKNLIKAHGINELELKSALGAT